MEPDEKLLQEKIQKYEATTPVWNKDSVWSSVTLPVSSTRQVAFYYAAASVVLAIAIAFLALERTQQKELQVRLAELELAIINHRINESSFPKQQLADVEELPCINQDSDPIQTTNSSVKEIKASDTSRKIDQPTLKISENTPALLTNISDGVKEDSEETEIAMVKLEPPTLPMQTTRVAAIFGVEKSSTHETQDKKLQLRFLATNPNEHESSVEPSLIRNISQK